MPSIIFNNSSNNVIDRNAITEKEMKAAFTPRSPTIAIMKAAVKLKQKAKELRKSISELSTTPKSPSR